MPEYANLGAIFFSTSAAILKEVSLLRTFSLIIVLAFIALHPYQYVDVYNFFFFVGV